MLIPSTGRTSRHFGCALTLAAVFSLGGCLGGGGGGGGSNSNSTTQFSISGQVSGLSSGQSVTVQNNSGDDLAIAANGAFTFAKMVDNNKTYNVTVLSQPSQENCTISNGSGTVSGANVTGINIACAAVSAKLGGAVSGLTSGQTFTLQYNGANNLPISNNGTFAFATPIQAGTNYDVTISTPPSTQTCSVNKGVGTAAKTDINNIAVVCSDQSYTVGGSVSGLTGTGFTLTNKLHDDLAISGNGAFTFATKLAVGGDYNIAVKKHPTGQMCTVTNNTGTIASSNVTSVSVVCVKAYTVGGNVTGLASGNSFTLKNNGGDSVTISANGAYTFPTALASGATYDVSLVGSSGAQVCTVSNGNGTIGTTNATNVNVICGIGHRISGTVIGLSGSGLVLKTNSGEQLPVTGTGEVGFQFTQSLSEGSTYSVTVAAQPTSPAETCSVSNGTGTVGTGDVTNVIVDCPFTFTWSQPTPQGGTIQRMRVLNNELVGVSNTGAVMFGDLTGANWKVRFAGTYMLRSIAWTGTQYVVVGASGYPPSASGVLLTSPDGATWTLQTTPASTSLNDVIWTGSTLVAVGDAGMIITSTDGITWTQRTAPTANNLYSIATGGSFTVAVGTTTIVASSNGGASWIQVRSGTGWEMYGVGYANGQFVAVGDGSGTLVAYPGKAAIQYSAPNTVLTWTTVSPAGVADLEDVAYDGTQWVAAGLGGTIATSPNGATWTLHDPEPTNPMKIHMDYYTALWNSSSGTVVAGLNGRILQSTSAVTWNKLDSGLASTGVNELIWTGTRAIAAAGNTYYFNSAAQTESVLMSSADGDGNWQKHATVTTKPIRSVTVNGNTWVTVGDGGEIEYSFNGGQTWTLAGSVTANNLYAVRHNGKYFIAVGANGTLVTSVDGASWTVRTVPTITSELSSIATITGRTVVVGAGGVATSDDGGDTWTYRGPSYGSNHVVSTGTKLLMYLGTVSWNYPGLGSTAYTSSDGITWTGQSLPTSPGLTQSQQIVWTGKTFLAFVSVQSGATALSPAIIESSDGGKWNLVNNASELLPYFGVSTMTSASGGRLLIGSGGNSILVGR